MENMTSISLDIIHHFFKVYIPSHSSHNLKIPTTFIQKMNGVVPGVSSLKDPLGRIWQVEVEKIEGTFYFQAGWREFVEANCLNLGDFMVFRFMGNSVFNVTIFDNSGCEKNNDLEDIDEEKQEHEEEVEVEVEVEGGGEREEDNIGGEKEAKQEQEHEEEGEEDIGEEKEAKQEHEEGEGEGGEGKEGEEDSGEEKEAKQEHKEGEGEGEEDIGEEKEQEGEGDNESADFDEPKNPYFIASVTMTRRYDLHIPQAVVQAVAKNNDMVLKPSMEFLDHNQIKWPIKVCFRKDGRRIITKGWKDFWTRNNLTSNDKCIFEFKPDEEIGSTSTVIKVSIIRGNSTGEGSLVPGGGR